MRHNQSGWSNYCSKHNKENFTEVDEEAILGRIRDLPVTEWNIKGAPDVRYIGPTSQDFAAAFHLVGNDTAGISSVCIDGINIVGVKALEKRTSTMQAEIETLKSGEGAILQLKQENGLLREEIESLKNELKKQAEILQAYLTDKNGEH